jgi:hypothetical protein
MTNNFQGGVLSYHKPHSDVPCTHSTPLVQEKALHELEKFPPKFPITLFSNDATISPETTGLPNETEMKPQGSSFSFKPKNFKFKNLFAKTKENLLDSRRKINFKSYSTIISKELYKKFRENTNFSRNLDPSEGINQEFRENPR